MREDHASYMHFTGPERLNKAIHTLEGIVRGVAADGTVGEREIGAVRCWLDEHREFAERHPFNELIPALDRTLKDGRIDDEEQADLLWLCERLAKESPYYDIAASDMQILHGMLGGIIADGEITRDELETVRNWMDQHDHLRGCWPYDEIDSLVTAVLVDGRISESESRLLASYFSQFTTMSGNRAVDLPLNEVGIPITGVCAVCPEVTFENQWFCFTGASKRCTRDSLAALVSGLGGRFCNTVSQKVNYLVIGADGNPCWAYACYGRKVEQAVELRKSGHAIILVHENDFWDSVESAKSV